MEEGSSHKKWLINSALFSLSPHARFSQTWIWRPAICPWSWTQRTCPWTSSAKGSPMMPASGSSLGTDLNWVRLLSPRFLLHLNTSSWRWLGLRDGHPVWYSPKCEEKRKDRHQNKCVHLFKKNPRSKATKAVFVVFDLMTWNHRHYGWLVDLMFLGVQLAWIHRTPNYNNPTKA